MRSLIGAAMCIGLALAATPTDAGAVAPERVLAKKAAVLELLHRKARKALATAAQDRLFPTYFHSHDPGEKESLKRELDHIALNVQSRFHVEEMCLINPEGEEISRIVGNEIAHDLATDEEATIFFAPGFAQRSRKVHVSPIYLSADADKWVVAYVTPIVVDGEKRAILHYEHGLEFYQAKLNKGMEGGGLHILAVTSDGFIVSDSRKPIPTVKQGGSKAPQAYFARFALAGHDLVSLLAALGGGKEGSGTLEGESGSYRVAFRNVENWTLLIVGSN